MANLLVTNSVSWRKVGEVVVVVVDDSPKLRC